MAQDQGSGLSQQIQESLLTQFTQLGFHTIEYRLENTLNLQPTADSVLSRDIKTLRQRQNIDFVITGTLTRQQHAYIVNARLVNTKDQRVVSAASTEIPINVMRGAGKYSSVMVSCIEANIKRNSINETFNLSMFKPMGFGCFLMLASDTPEQHDEPQLMAQREVAPHSNDSVFQTNQAVLNNSSFTAAPTRKNINHYVRGIMQDLVENLQYVNDKTPIAVSSFVYLDVDHNSTTLLGNQLAESFIHEPHTFGVPVVDFKTTDYMRVTPSGDYVFSRDYLELNQDQNFNG